MAMYKCKECGGELELIPNSSVCICGYCGTKETVPVQNSENAEKKMNLFNRANQLRSDCKFSMALHDYEQIVAEFPQEAEAYWGLVLCKYGIEYVDDPKTERKVPTCHRLSYESVLDDNDFEMVLEYADSESRPVYRRKAEEIEAIRSKVIEISSKEDSYDIFICYKDKDEKGERTIDSVTAEKIYTQLDEKGYRVFFSRITLEDKLGQEYEPYIFKALTTARVMLVFGTCYEYFNAVWVKNEWSRFLDMMRRDQKKVLIPCFRDVDAYDLPKEFVGLQAQDMGKLGADQDLLRGIEKILKPQKKQTQASSADATVESLLKRAGVVLESGDYGTASQLCERVLDADPTNSMAYRYSLYVALRVRNGKEFEECENDLYDLDKFSLYEKHLSADDKKKFLEIANRNRYRRAKGIMKKAEEEKEPKFYDNAALLFLGLQGYKDAQKLAKTCSDAAGELRKSLTRANRKSTAAEWIFKIICVAMYFIMPLFMYYSLKRFDDVEMNSFSHPTLTIIVWCILDIALHCLWEYSQGRGYLLNYKRMQIFNGIIFGLEAFFLFVLGIMDYSYDYEKYALFSSLPMFIGVLAGYVLIGIGGMAAFYNLGNERY